MRARVRGHRRQPRDRGGARVARGDVLMDALVPLHERALIVRLLAVVDRWRAADRSGRIDPGWAHFVALPPGALALAVRSPLLHGWVGAAERLLECGAVARYPEAHAARHAIDLGRVALDLAELARRPAHGELDVLRRDRVSLALGRAVLRFGGAAPRRVRWSLGDHQLWLGDDRGHFAEVDLARGVAGEVTPPWTIAWLPEASTIAIDLEPQPVVDAVRAAIEALSPALADRARHHLRTVARHDPDEPWVAGVARVAPAIRFDTAQLVACIERDRAERALELHALVDGPTLGTAFVAADDLRARVVEVVARLSAARALAAEPAPEDVAAWSALAHSLRSAGLDALTEALLPSLIDEAAPPHAPGLPAGQALHANHRAVEDPIDWSMIDDLCNQDRSQLEPLARLGTCAFTDEQQAWQAAAARYVMARFAACIDALRACLASGPDLDRYWILLAFALRHLGERDRFDHLVFDGLRDPAILRDLVVADP